MSLIENNACSLFAPVNESAQKKLCSKVNFPLIIKHRPRKSNVLGPPSEKCSIVGDGNCLFRALSYVITGRQSYHKTIRAKIIEHMKTIEDQLQPHMNCSLENYLQMSKMKIDGICGTDIEIFAAASLLSTDIFVYTNISNTYNWQHFSKKMLDGSFPENESAIYIEHVSRVHYDVVLDVSFQSTKLNGTQISKVYKRKKSNNDYPEKITPKT